MSVRDTSVAAYKEIKPDVGEKQALILGTIGRAKRPVNNQEIAKFLKKPINTVTPRTNELVKLGRVELAFKEVYPATNRKVCYWKINETHKDSN